MKRSEPNEAKFVELVLYAAEKSVSDPAFGATKLNKILFFSDFISYATYGEAITGMEYQRLKYGPAPRRLLPLQRELIQSGRAILVPESHAYVQKRLVPLKGADLSLFSGRDIALVDSVIDSLRDQNATGVSELSHHWSMGWRATRDGETIPYETVFWQDTEPTPEIQELARQSAKDHQLID